ncbi:MAG: hypothetical protein RLZZ220_623 [Pseudomonadota bacterium]|jgi:hypothetical protein|nr:DUF4810 domain-containing protein [Zoogloea sp.]MBP7627277.1 DUF4810 domain-containing protein [Zoogloea sp.]
MRHLSIPRGRLALGALAVSLLAGCATRPQPLYYWGDYPNVVYSHFQNAKGQQEQIQALEAIREKARAKGQALPPGFQAHLAMLYGQSGQTDRLAQNLEAEKQQFPEGAPFMDFILKKFERKPAEARP